MTPGTSLEQVLDHSPSIIFTKDLAGRYLFVNRQFERAAGMDRAAILGRTALEVFPEAIAGRFLDNDRRVLEARRPMEFEDEVEVRGQRRVYQSSVFPLLGPGGEPYGLSGILRDVTTTGEASYRAIFEASEDAIFIHDFDTGAILDVNPKACVTYGYAREELLQLQVGDFSAGAEHTTEAALARIAEARRTGGPVRFEWRRKNKDGSLHWDEVTLKRAEIAGKPVILAITSEITARKAAEEALRASESRYRAIFNAAADSMVLRDAEFRVVDVNPAYEAMSRRRREEALGRSDLTMSPPELTAYVRELHARAVAGEPVVFEARARRKDGEEFDIETRGVPILHEGKPHVLYIGRDITARKSAEQVLRASEEQYRAIFNAAADALVLRDADFRIVDVNPTYEAMSGYSRQEVVGVDRLVANPAESQERIRELHRKALGGEPFTLETVRVSKDGTRREVELRGVPINHRGQPHVLYIGRDISARKRAEEERSRLEAQLLQAQRMEAIGRLTGGIAHDFNNLLTSIMGYVTLASERAAAADDAKLGAHLEQALASSRRARDLIQQMLTFSRGKRGAPRAVQLAGAVEASLNLVRGSLPSTVEIRTALDAAVPPVLVDPVQLDQVVINLCINARDAMGGVGEVSVSVRSLRTDAVCASCRKGFAGRYAEVAVQDNGAGIAPATLERMFEPFFSTKEVGRGSGMGLATVHGIVHEHGGHILVETRAGEGACFRALFPLPEAAHAASPVPGAAPAAAKRAPLSGRVLVVDDEVSVGTFMRELLESWGLAAEALTSPLGVLERVSRDRAGYDLVILDQTMPGMTGMSLARELSAACPELPIILYTGRGDPISRGELDGAGVRALLHKPVEPQVLYSLLRENLPA